MDDITLKDLVNGWINCDVLNKPYRIFEVYVPCKETNSRYYLEPNLLLNETYVSVLGLHMVICHDVITYQKELNKIMLDSDSFKNSYFNNIINRWGYEHQYFEASANMEILFCERFNRINFKLIWLLLLLSDLSKFKSISNLDISELISYIVGLLKEKNIELPYLHVKTKHQFFDKFTNKMNLCVNDYQELLYFIYDYTCKWLIDNRIALVKYNNIPSERMTQNTDDKYKLNINFSDVK